MMSFRTLALIALLSGSFISAASAAEEPLLQDMRISTFGPEDWDFRSYAVETPFTTHRLGNNRGGPETSIVQRDGEHWLSVFWKPGEIEQALGLSVAPNWKGVVKQTFVFSCTILPLELGSSLSLELVNGGFSLHGEVLRLTESGKLLARTQGGKEGALAEIGQLKMHRPYSLKLTCNLDDGSYQLEVTGLDQPLHASGPLPGTPKDFTVVSPRLSGRHKNPCSRRASCLTILSSRPMVSTPWKSMSRSPTM